MTLTDAYPIPGGSGGNRNSKPRGNGAGSGAVAGSISDNFLLSSSPMPNSYAIDAMAAVSAVKVGGSVASTASTTTNTSDGIASSSGTSSAPKTARCKRCGLLISRSMEAIEAHMEECGSVNAPHGRNNSVAVMGGAAGGGAGGDKSYILNGPDGPITISHGASKSFGGITRRPELENYGTRIIYRTARKQSGKYIRPREVCALQDSFIDEDGVCYVYEISVRHCDVMGLPDYVTADVMVSGVVFYK